MKKFKKIKDLDFHNLVIENYFSKENSKKLLGS